MRKDKKGRREEKVNIEENLEAIRQLGPERVDLPPQMVQKMHELLEYEKTYLSRLSKLKPVPVPEKKGFLFSSNKKEIEWALKTNQKAEETRKHLAEEHQKKIEELKEEKRKAGITQDLFFDYPLAEGTVNEFGRKIRTDIGSNGRWTGTSLYTYKKSAMTGQVIYTSYGIFDNQGFAQSRMLGEIDFYISREKEDKIYFRDGYSARKIRPAYLTKTFLDSDKYIILYCDREYMLANADKQFDMYYLCDIEYKQVSEFNSSRKLDVDTVLERYYMGSPTLTDGYLSIGEGLTYKNFKEYAGKKRSNWYSPRGLQGCHEDSYMKKAIVVEYEDRIVTIIVPKGNARVSKIYSVAEPTASGIIAKRIRVVSAIEGSSWEHYLFTTMHCLACVYGDMLSPPDLTELKPDGISDELWRMWVRLRETKE